MQPSQFANHPAILYVGEKALKAIYYCINRIAFCKKIDLTNIRVSPELFFGIKGCQAKMNYLSGGHRLWYELLTFLWTHATTSPALSDQLGMRSISPEPDEGSFKDMRKGGSTGYSATIASLGRADRQRGRFRSFLLGALDYFLAHAAERARAAKRGGGCQWVFLDDDTAEDRYQLAAPEGMTAEKVFDARWAA